MCVCVWCVLESENTSALTVTDTSFQLHIQEPLNKHVPAALTSNTKHPARIKQLWWTDFKGLESCQKHFDKSINNNVL